MTGVPVPTGLGQEPAIHLMVFMHLQQEEVEQRRLELHLHPRLYLDQSEPVEKTTVHRLMFHTPVTVYWGLPPGFTHTGS